jgi:hypothetical protein
MQGDADAVASILLEMLASGASAAMSRAVESLMASCHLHKAIKIAGAHVACLLGNH